jgi:hypothetical protein
MDIRAALFAIHRGLVEREAWERENPTSIEGILDWIDQLREAFGDPEPDRTPWHGDDFKID